MSDTKGLRGPWFWNVNPKTHIVELETTGGFTVMDFVRYGMSGAAPRFAVDGLMVRADELLVVVPGREHHSSWFQTLNHPAANMIGAAPDLVEALELAVSALAVSTTPLPEDRELVRQAVINARGALAKARGT